MPLPAAMLPTGPRPAAGGRCRPLDPSRRGRRASARIFLSDPLSRPLHAAPRALRKRSNAEYQAVPKDLWTE